MAEENKILIVDDDESTRTLLVSLIELLSEGKEDKSVKIDIAINGQEAWKKIEQAGGEYEVVVTDIDMPVMDGFDLCRKIQEKYPGIKVIFMSGREGLEGTPYVGHRFFRKPIEGGLVTCVLDSID